MQIQDELVLLLLSYLGALFRPRSALACPNSNLYSHFPVRPPWTFVLNPSQPIKRSILITSFSPLFLSSPPPSPTSSSKMSRSHFGASKIPLPGVHIIFESDNLASSQWKARKRPPYSNPAPHPLWLSVQQELQLSEAQAWSPSIQHPARGCAQLNIKLASCKHNEMLLYLMLYCSNLGFT